MSSKQRPFLPSAWSLQVPVLLAQSATGLWYSTRLPLFSDLGS